MSSPCTKSAVRLVLDPNVRPTLIPDKAEYEAKLSRWLELADIVKVSTQDLSWLYPDKTRAEVAANWLDRGPSAVIITDGGDGVTLYRPGEKPLLAASKQVEVVDTVGGRRYLHREFDDAAARAEQTSKRPL